MWLPPIDGEMVRWAATGFATAVGWLVGRHDKLIAEKTQRKEEQAEARRAAKALAGALDAKNEEITYLRGMVDRLLGEPSHSSTDREAHG